MNKKIKILFLLPHLLWGGLETVAYLLAKGLDKERFDLTIAYWKGGHYYSDSLKKLGINVIKINSHIFSLKYFLSLREILNQNTYDIIHSWFFDEDLAAFLSKKIFSKKTKLVSGMHTPFFTKRRHYWRYRLIGRCFERIICCSNWYRERLISGGLDPSKIITIHNGIDLYAFPLSPSPKEIQSIRREFNLCSHDMIVASAARLSFEKGIDLLIQAIPKILSEIPQARFLIFGAGPEEDRLKFLSKQLAIENYIDFAGFSPDVKRLFFICDIFVLPSREDTFPITVLEAMAARRPICATAVGGIPEIVISGETGILVAPNQIESLEKGIITLLKLTDAERKKLGKAGYMRVKKNFSAPVMVSKYQNIYETVVLEKGFYTI